jgi:hypothetical protein
MMKSHKVFAAGTVFLSTALAASLFISGESSKTEEKPLKLNPAQVLTWDCEFPEYKPESITITCADGGIFVEMIQWSSWSQDGAAGTGIFSENLCQPNCAEGKRVTAPVKLTLSNLTELKGKHYLRTLDISTSDGKDFPWGGADGFQWDVMEFVQSMEEK